MNLEREQARKIYRTGEWAKWIGVSSFGVAGVLAILPVPAELKLVALGHLVVSFENALEKGRFEREIMEKYPGIELEEPRH